MNGPTTLALAVIAAGFLVLALHLHHGEAQRQGDLRDELASRRKVKAELDRQEARGEDRWWLS